MLDIEVDDTGMPKEILESIIFGYDVANLSLVIAQYAKRIESVDMKVLKDPDCLPEIYKMLRTLDLRDFNSIYSSFASLLAQDEIGG